jgi:antitoxin (DNA-binding transcriptional repressor) of toxin-antitoxin stability system
MYILSQEDTSYTEDMSAEMIDMADSSEGREVNITQARPQLPSLVHAAANEGEITYITINGRRLAAVVPADVAQRHEDMEDEYWARRVAEAEQSGTVSWNEAIVALEGGQA